MRPGDVVANRFEIESLAGSGGMSTVYRARDLAAGGSVALKLLDTLGEHDAARFAREAAVLAELTHPGIVRYVAHGLAKHQHYIAMEWLEGETLHERLVRGRLRVAETVALGRAVGSAIAAAHLRDVVHRDLKPMNLFVPGGDLAQIKVLDFGIARRMQQAGMLTATGAVIGTPGYMAPEQVRGETALDPRTDVFALGCVLYRAVTGVAAFGGGESLAVLAKVLLEDVTPPRQLVPEIPAALDTLLLAMLAKDPVARPADGRAVVDALSRVGQETVQTIDAVAPTQRSSPGIGTDTLRAAITQNEQRLVSVVLTSSADEHELQLATAGAYGGRLERIGDAGLVLFAHAEVATDHAARAARCALALREVVPGGAFVVASGRASIARLVVGDVIDRAVAAVKEVAPGEILVDDATANLLDDRFAITPRGDHKLLREAREPASPEEPERLLLGKVTPIVGRDRELATLEALWAECADESVARVVLVTAPPGGGKSRVRQELVRRVLQRDDPAEALIGRGDLLRAGSPFAILADLIRRTASVREGDALADQRAALHARVSRHVAAADGDRVTHLLGELTGVAFPSEASEALRAARADAQARGDAMRRAWVEWLEAECAHHPVLLVLEDLHWGDRATIDLVDAALRELSQSRLMVVAFARPEISDQFPKLWATRALQEIRLPQLTKKAAERLVRELLGAGVSRATMDQIVERAAGNAFFLEELIRAVAEGHGDQLPDSVLSMLQLRLDALGPAARRVLRAASVFGEVFWSAGVAALIDADPAEDLAILVERELIAPVPRSQLPGQLEYAFRHDLVREAAFAMLGANDRVAAHRVAGAWLVDHGYGDAIALAGHFSAGGYPERAAELYARAAEQGITANDSTSVFAHAERGLACLAAIAEPDREVAGRLRIAIAEARNWRGEHAIAGEVATAARTLLEPGTPLWFRATDEAYYAAGRSGDIPRTIALVHDLTTVPPISPAAALQQVRSVARAAIIMLRFGPPPIAAALFERVEELAAPLSIDAGTEQRLHSLRSLAARARGDAVTSLAELEAGERACEVACNLRELAFSFLSSTSSLTELGRPEQALEYAHNGIAIAERIGASGAASLLYFSLGLTEIELGRFADARTHAERALAECPADDHAAEGIARWVLARSLFELGDRDAADRELAQAIERLGPYPQYHSFARATAARHALARGDLATAREYATKAMALMRPDEGYQEGESLIRLVEIEVLEAAGDPGATRATETAIARLETRASRIPSPYRETFLAKPDNAATLRRKL